MKKKMTISQMFAMLSPKGKMGRPPVMRPCPHCHIEFSATEMRAHQPACKMFYKQPAPPPAVPTDLENQVLSNDPLERLRQLDEQEQDRILRTLEP